MDVTRTDQPLSELEADALVVPLAEDQALEGPAAQLDQAMGGLLQRLILSQAVDRKACELTTVLAPAGVKAQQVTVVGLGPADQVDRGVLYRAAATASRHLSSKARRDVALAPPAGAGPAEVESLVAGVIFGSEGQDLYRSEKKQHPFHQLYVPGGPDEALERGRILGQAVNLTRRLVNEPSDQIFPDSFAEIAAQIASQWDLQCEIWDERRLAEERCGALLAVSRGSARPPRLVMLRYQGGRPEAPVVGLVGKGVTFDSGGLSLKTPEHMLTMKCDMAGAATVLGAMQAIATLKIPVNVCAYMGLVENLVSADSYKLGDVLRTRKGKTIEVHNTDAEGRLVLADVLAVAVDQGVERIIDLATLTGACVVALGRDVAGLMTNDQGWCDQVAQAAARCGERAWQLPMFPEYAELIRSEVADIKNVGDGRWAGAITAAKLLEEFVDGRPWTHIDIAGPAFVEKPKPWISGGGSGVFVRTLVEVADALAAAQKG